MASNRQKQRVLSLKNPLQLCSALGNDAFCKSGGRVLVSLLTYSNLCKVSKALEQMSQTDKGYSLV